MKEPIVRTIVITGGPCGGKTTALAWIQAAFARRGYDVLFLSEVATELISGGIAPWTCRTNADYQGCQFRLQQHKEEVYHRAARRMKGDKVLIVCDRGILDNKAYMTQEEYAAVLAELGTDEEALLARYDGVFHLVTAAKGAEAFYTLENNAARRESAEEAAALDDRLIRAWQGHPHLRVIENTGRFEDKMEHLLREIADFLGETIPAT